VAIPAVASASYPTPVEVRAQLLTSIRYSYARIGQVANVKPGSDHYIRMDAISKRISIAIANNKIALANFSPLTATGADLVTLAAQFGVVGRAASVAAGLLLCTATGSVTIPRGWIATAPSGISVATVTENSGVVTGTKVSVQTVETGIGANIAEGVVVKWVDAAVGGLATTAVVTDGDISGGAEADDDERLRERLLLRLAFPGVGGNWSQVGQWAKEASASVGRAYVYPAVRGPASYDVAIIGGDGDRVLTSTIVDEVDGFINSQMPGQNDLNTTSVALEGVDVVVDLELPLPMSTGGAGGGWRDPQPWPSSLNAGDGRPVRVTSVSGNTMTVNSDASDPPVAGKRFGVWDTDAKVMREFTVASVGGIAGAYVITVALLTSDLVTANLDEQYVSAGAVNLKAYASELYDAINNLGCGEKTASIDILPRGKRQPAPDVEAPYALTSVQLRGLSVEHPEILDIDYGARLAAGAGTTLTAPSVPGATADPPNLLSLNSLAFRKA